MWCILFALYGRDWHVNGFSRFKSGASSWLHTKEIDTWRGPLTSDLVHICSIFGAHFKQRLTYVPTRSEMELRWIAAEYKQLKNVSKSSSVVEIDCSGLILWQKLSVRGVEAKVQRSNELLKRCFAKLSHYSDSILPDQLVSATVCEDPNDALCHLLGKSRKIYFWEEFLIFPRKPQQFEVSWRMQHDWES